MSHRDAEADAVFTVKRAPGDPAWRLTGEVDPGQGGPRLSPERQAILAVLKAADKPLSPKEVAARTWSGEGEVPQRHVHVVTNLLRRLEADQLVVTPAYGRYCLPSASSSHS